ncbi:MAG: hypothetical protein J5819_07070 [Eubacterium sp.]|nr:hypothetical protein [Eubacterium sp.]
MFQKKTNESVTAGRGHRRRFMGSLFSVVLAFSLLLTPASVSAAQSDYAVQTETTAPADASLRDSVQFTVNYDALSTFEKKLYDMVNQSVQSFNYIDMGYFDFAEKNHIDMEAEDNDFATAYQKYIASGQTLRMETDPEFRSLSSEKKNQLITGITSAYSADHPLDMRVMFTDLAFDYDENYVYFSIFTAYEIHNYDKRQQKADAAYQKAVSAIRADKRFEEGNKPAIELIVHDYICSRVKYTMPDDEKPEYMNYHSTYGPLVQNKGVCDGIAYLTSLLNNTFGIETHHLTSNYHAWNLVKLDDEYYELDNTWDLSDEPGVIRIRAVSDAHFNVTSEMIRKDDVDGTATEDAHVREYLGEKLPEATGTKYNYENVWRLTGMLTAPPASENGIYPEKNNYRFDGLVYDLSNDGVAYLTDGRKKKGKVVIPDYIEYNGYYYDVCSIMPNAFKNNKKITSVVIPYLVAFVQEDSFKGCKKLKCITLYDAEVSVGAFTGIKKNAVFYVCCRKDQFAEIKAAIKKSGVKMPRIKRVEEKD